jgi:hypothetical protein
MSKKKCVYCKQIWDGTTKAFMEIQPCNAPDGDGHLWAYNSAWKRQNTEKFPFIYFVALRGYVVNTTDESKWMALQTHLDANDIFDLTTEQINKLSIQGFGVVRKYQG